MASFVQSPDRLLQMLRVSGAGPGAISLVIPELKSVVNSLARDHPRLSSQLAALIEFRLQQVLTAGSRHQARERGRGEANWSLNTFFTGQISCVVTNLVHSELPIHNEH